MPSSSPLLLTPIVNLLMRLRPQSVLDVGCGMGKWGVLCREYLDAWDGRESLAHRIRLDAVEIHKPYIGLLHHTVYDAVWVDDAVDFLDGGEVNGPLPSLERYDLILCIDVIEHFDEERGKRFLAAAMKRCKTLLISTPVRPSVQGAVFGNEHERHVSVWTPDDFAALGVADIWQEEVFWIGTLTPKEQA